MPKFMKKPEGEGRGEWSEDDMKLAVAAVLEKKMSERAAAVRYNIPRSTLQRKVKAISNNQSTAMSPQMGFFKLTFEENFEAQLVDHMRDLDSRLMPLSKTEFLKLAFDLAELLKLTHRFNKEKKMAGKDCYDGFMKRHPELSYRKPESTSLMRCVGFNMPQVERFFNQLKALQDKHSFRPSRIFNGDETGVSCVHENDKVITMKGKRQVGKITSGERGRNVTLMFCMSATGQFIPPLFIFPRKRMNDRLMIGAPAESISFPTANGWMTSEAFLAWLKHFISFVKPSEKDPVLLIIDGHCSHKELDVILEARANHIHMLSFPPHTTHKLQPLDRSFMKPFKNCYNAECSLWMRANPGCRINDYDIAKIVAHAYKQVCRLDIAENGFKCTGIYPQNPNIFTDLDFMGSEITNIPQPSSNEETSVVQPSTNANSGISLSSAVLPNSTAVISVISSTAPVVLGPSSEVDLNLSTDSLVGLNLSLQTRRDDPTLSPSLHPDFTKSYKQDFASALKQVSPMPSCAANRIKSRKRKVEKSEILTSTPVKNLLISKRTEEESKEAAKKTKQRLGLNNVKKGGAKEAKTKPKPKVKKNLTIDYTNPTPGTSKDSEVKCIACGETFEENWIQCKVCKGWSHELCADIDNSLFFFCDLCKVKKAN